MVPVVRFWCSGSCRTGWCITARSSASTWRNARCYELGRQRHERAAALSLTSTPPRNRIVLGWRSASCTVEESSKASSRQRTLRSRRADCFVYRKRGRIVRRLRLRHCCAHVPSRFPVAYLPVRNRTTVLLEHLSGPGPFLRFPSLDIRVAVHHERGATHRADRTTRWRWRRGDTVRPPNLASNRTSPPAPAGAGRVRRQTRQRCSASRDENVRGYVSVAYGHYFSLENNLFANNLTDDQFKVKAESVSVRFMGRTAERRRRRRLRTRTCSCSTARPSTRSRGSSVEPLPRVGCAICRPQQFGRERARFVSASRRRSFIGSDGPGRLLQYQRLHRRSRQFSTRGEIALGHDASRSMSSR